MHDNEKVIEPFRRDPVTAAADAMPEIPQSRENKEIPGYVSVYGGFRYQLHDEDLCPEELELKSALLDKGLKPEYIIAEHVRRLNFYCHAVEKEIKGRSSFTAKHKAHFFKKNIIVEVRPDFETWFKKWVRHYPLYTRDTAQAQYHAIPVLKVMCFLPECDDKYINWMFEYQQVHYSGYERPRNLQTELAEAAPF